LSAANERLPLAVRGPIVDGPTSLSGRSSESDVQKCSSGPWTWACRCASCRCAWSAATVQGSVAIS